MMAEQQQFSPFELGAGPDPHEERARARIAGELAALELEAAQLAEELAAAFAALELAPAPAPVDVDAPLTDEETRQQREHDEATRRVWRALDRRQPIADRRRLLESPDELRRRMDVSRRLEELKQRKENETR